jgi:hypothetical protein
MFKKLKLSSYPLYWKMSVFNSYTFNITIDISLKHQQIVTQVSFIWVDMKNKRTVWKWNLSELAVVAKEHNGKKMILLLNVRYDVFTVMTMKNAVLWDVTPCGSCKNRCFRGMSRLHHQLTSNQRTLLRNTMWEFNSRSSSSQCTSVANYW